MKTVAARLKVDGGASWRFCTALAVEKEEGKIFDEIAGNSERKEMKYASDHGRFHLVLTRRAEGPPVLNSLTLTHCYNSNKTMFLEPGTDFSYKHKEEQFNHNVVTA